jgi:predicted NAD/FAD-dependent oxidoreductase
VQATPASSGLRLAPDRSGYENLVLAGDWTDCGLNAGCIEAAVLSGVQAAAALNEEGDRELGGWR